MKIKSLVAKLVIASMLMGTLPMSGTVSAEQPAETTNPYKYTAIEDGLEITNGQGLIARYFYNRPLFGGYHGNDEGSINNHLFAYVGDRPSISFIQKVKIANVFFGIKDGKWLHEMESITAKYISGHEEYEITDESFNGTITVTFVRATEFDGVLTKVSLPDELKDKLVVVAGGTSDGGKDYNEAILSKMNFVPDKCSGTTVDTDENSFVVYKNGAAEKLSGISNVGMTFETKDATKFNSGVSELLNSTDSSAPIVVGTTSENTENDIYVAFTIESLDDSKITNYQSDVANNFNKSIEYVTNLSNTVEIDTPDEQLDSTLMTQVVSLDSVINDPYIMHGGTRWHTPFSGWRYMYAFSILGDKDKDNDMWNKALKSNAEEYIDLQEKSSLEDPSIEGRIPSIPTNSLGGNNRYNMGEVFVDQLLYYYENSNDVEFMKNYGYECIKSHLDFIEDWIAVKDTDNNNTNLYENYLNAWNTDNKWTNGGPSTIATTYAWRAYNTMAKIADDLGYTDDVTTYQAKADAIESAFRDTLWSKNNGVFAEYKDKFGNKLLHDAPDLSSIYTPIDLGFADEFEAYQSLKYSENYIKRVPTPKNGELVYTSNWLPSYYSTYGIYPGEMTNLALSYFQNGQPEEGMKVIKGLEAVLYNNHGDINNVTDENYATGGNLDFPDTTSIFIKSITDGMFGINVNAPDNYVTIKPALPKEWDKASIKTPKLSYSYEFENNAETFNVTNNKGYNCKFEVPTKTTSVESVTVNDSNVEFEVKEGVGGAYVTFTTNNTTKQSVVIEYNEGAIPTLTYDTEVDFGGTLNITTSDGTITEIMDMQNVVKSDTADTVNSSSSCEIELNETDGYHTVFAKVNVDDVSMWLPVDFKINEKVENLKNNSKDDLIASTIDLDSYVNQDLKKLHTNTYSYEGKQTTDYIVPRFPWSDDSTRTVGVNGRSWWNKAVFGESQRTVDGITGLPSESGIFESIAGVPFRVSNVNDMNAVFTSMYGNFDEKINIPVNKTGQKMCFMLAVSTNNMQSHVENARITINFADGSNKVLSLSNPENIDDWLSYGVAPYAQSGIIQPLGGLNGKAHANILEVNFEDEKEITSIDFECIANEVLAGLLGATVYSFGDTEKLAEAKKLIVESETVAEFYNSEKLNVLKEKADALKALKSGQYTDEQLITAVKELSAAIDEYKSSSTVSIAFTPTEDVVGEDTVVTMNTVSDIEVELSSDTLVANSELKAVFNADGTKYSGSECYLALYKEGILQKLEMNEVQAGTISTEVSMTLPNDVDNCDVKTFIWDGKMSPVISSNNDNVEIRYTTDGSEPTSGSTLYDSPITLSAPTTFKAAPFYNGIAVGATVVKKYSFAYTNLALNKDTVASNYYKNQESYSASKATDGDKTSRWATDNLLDSVSLTIDLGSAVSFNKVVLNEALFNNTSRFGNIKVEYLDENRTDWKEVYSSSANEETTVIGSADLKQSVRELLFPAVTSSKVRVTIGTVGDTKPGPSLFECEVCYDLNKIVTPKLELGKYITMGEDNGTPITWRIVDTEDDNFVVIADKILSTKMKFDAGNSNYWPESDIYTWLNNSFLTTAFTADEQNMIASKEHKNIITAGYEDKADSGSVEYRWTSTKISEAYDVVSYNDAYYVTGDEKIFLPDIKQVYDMEVINKDVLGANYGTPKDASGRYVYAWLRTPMVNGQNIASTTQMLLTTSAAGVLGNGTADASEEGVRPMMYLDKNITIADGIGTAGNPFTIKMGE